MLDAAPEAATMGGLTFVTTNDIFSVHLSEGTANTLIDDDELAAKGAFSYPDPPTLWQETKRSVC